MNFRAMQTYPILNEEGKLHAFEINNWWVGRSGAVRIIEKIPDVLVTRRSKELLSEFREEIFCQFELHGVQFQIDEPYGDNSRYWIGKTDPGWCPELETIERAFREA